jgi:hypothetical protein
MKFRSRARYGALALAMIVAGLVVHLTPVPLGDATRDITGDALWAAMMFGWVGAVAPDARLAIRSVSAFAICAVVETSQLIHTPSLDAARETTIGHLVLGSGFDPRDFLAYAMGIAAAALLEGAIRRARSGAGN